MPNVPNNLIVLDNLASGIDRNGSTTGKGGTPSGLNSIKVWAAGGVTSIENIPVEELDDSPTLERAEQCTVTHHFRLAYTEALNRLAIYGRGALVRDDAANFYRVLSSSVQYQKGGKALLSITSESMSFDVPPDEFSCTPTRLGLDIMKHPRYFYALMPTNQIQGFSGVNDTDAQIAAKQAIIRAIQAYRENPFIPTTANINGMTGLLHDTINANLVTGKFVVTKPNPAYNPAAPTTGPDPITGPFTANAHLLYWSVNTSSSDPNDKVKMAMAAAKELIGKLWRMEDSPMVNGLELSWTEYHFRPPYIDLGGYVQDPTTATPPLPDYFYSVSYPPNAGFTFFDALSYRNPQCFSVTGRYGGGTAISWLRDADTIEYNRTWFRVTRKWLGAPVGAWDTDLYSQNNRPSKVTDYRDLILS